jgi:antitoxin component YwqK of YwqJK toxin-antitoxin module
MTSTYRMRNMQKLLVTLCFSLFCTTVIAQENNELVNSGDILKKGIKLHDDNKYKDALALYTQVPKSDTNYNTVLYEMAVTAYADSSFETARNYAIEGLKLFPYQDSKFYAVLANTMDELGKPYEAIAVYDTILSKYPNQYSAWFNKGIVYYKQKKYKDATLCFQRTVLINSYYASAHYFLGKIAMEQGNLPQAMLSFTTSLLINPSNKYANIIVGYLSAISSVNKDVAGYIKLHKASNQDDFEVVQEIITSKLALDKKYKLTVDLEDGIVRQLHVLMEKLEYNAGDKGFWMQYYVPLYQNIYKEKLLEPTVFYMFSNLNIKSVQDYNKHNKKELQKLFDVATNYLDEIRNTRTLQQTAREAVKERYIFDEGNVYGKGQYELDAKRKKILKGYWEFYNDNGKVSAKGKYNEDGNREGEWNFYYSDGVLKETSMYKNGKAEGKSTVWHTNGLVYSISNYIDDKEDGKEESWYFNGIKRSEENFKAGVKNGDYKYYNESGYLTSAGKYVNDKYDGENFNYHLNSTVSTSINYTDGLQEGTYKEFFEDGTLKLQGNITKGKRDGEWKEFYKDGKIKAKNSYVAGSLEGEQTTYYQNGKVERLEVYKKGKLEGLEEEFDDDGKKYCEIIFEKGRLKDIKFLNKKGETIANTTSRRGDANIVFYDADGNKTNEGFFTKDGDREGKATYYYKNGKISAEANYKNGLLNGDRTTYYLNGNKQEEGTYKDDEADGYFKFYHKNGKLKSEGWFVNGQRQGTHISYNQLGVIENKIYYLNDKQYGYSQYYYANGKMDYESEFSYDWFKKTQQFDTLGSVIANVDLTKGNGILKWKNIDGTPLLDAIYEHNFKHGEYKTYRTNGSVSKIENFNYGYRQGAYKIFHENGKVYTDGAYAFDEPVGVWKYYFDNGQLNFSETYVNGVETGIEANYKQDGSLDKVINYKGGNLNGSYTFYADNNEIALVLNYKEDIIESYTYMGKDGNLLPQITLKNGTGKIKAFFKNGILSAEIDVEIGYINGTRNFYYTSGKPFVIGTRTYNSDNGVKKVYYSNGQLEKEENYLYDNLHGIRKTYNANGSLKTEENWNNGALNGTYKAYDANGILKETKQYFFGSLLTVK